MYIHNSSMVLSALFLLSVNLFETKTQVRLVHLYVVVVDDKFNMQLESN